MKNLLSAPTIKEIVFFEKKDLFTYYELIKDFYLFLLELKKIQLNFIKVFSSILKKRRVVIDLYTIDESIYYI